MSQITIKPQEGRQEEFLSSSADIVVYGGAKGGGKTFGLLLEPLRHSHIKGFNGTIFRRTKEQIRNTGALWDSANAIYSLLDADLRESILEIRCQEMKLKFSHLEYEKDKLSWDGSQICYLGFDELQHFSATQFWYLVACNRSTCGVAPYIRATCMADESSWVKKLIAWWLDFNGEYPNLEKSGIIRWFIRIDDDIFWGDSAEELVNSYPGSSPMSFTFIPSFVHDNKILLEKNPQYLSALQALPKVERERKEKGNWKIKPEAGMYFRREWFEIIDAPPVERAIVRFWDRAATAKTPKNDPCWTAGVKISRDKKGYFYIEHVTRFRLSVFQRDQRIKNVSSIDSKTIQIGLEQEPGASGVAEAQGLVRMLAGYRVKAIAPRDNKVTRAMPFSSQAEAGNVKIIRGPWNDDYLTELENFDGSPKKKMDQVDATSGGFEMLDKGQIVIESYSVPSPEIQKTREIDSVDKDFRGEFEKGRKNLI